MRGIKGANLCRFGEVGCAASEIVAGPSAGTERLGAVGTVVAFTAAQLLAVGASACRFEVGVVAGAAAVPLAEVGCPGVYPPAGRHDERVEEEEGSIERKLGSVRDSADTCCSLKVRDSGPGMMGGGNRFSAGV